MTDRTTRELVVLVVSVTLAVVLILTVAGVVTVEIVDPSRDTSRAVGAIGSAVTALTGVAVGYIARGARTPGE